MSPGKVYARSGKKAFDDGKSLFQATNSRASVLELQAELLKIEWPKCAEEHYTQSARLCSAAVTMRERAHTPLPPAESEASFGEEWAIGTSVTHNEAIDYALSHACIY
jgi:hypothetical protein